MPEYIIYYQRTERGKTIILADDEHTARMIAEKHLPMVEDEITSTTKGAWEPTEIKEKE